MSNDGDRRWHCWPGLPFLSRGRCGRACQATTWLVVCRCAALHALWRPSVPGVPNDIFLSHALLLRHPQQSYEGGAKLWRGAVYRSTTRVSSRLPKTFARRLAADLFSRRNARADAHSSFGIFKGYLSWTFRRADTFRTFVSTDPCQRVDALETTSAMICVYPEPPRECACRVRMCMQKRALPARLTRTGEATTTRGRGLMN